MDKMEVRQSVGDPKQSTVARTDEFNDQLLHPFQRANTLGVAVDFGAAIAANVPVQILARRTQGVRTCVVIVNNHATQDMYVSFTINPVVGQGIFVKSGGGNLIIQLDFEWNGELWVIAAATGSFCGTEFYQ